MLDVCCYRIPPSLPKPQVGESGAERSGRDEPEKIVFQYCEKEEEEEEEEEDLEFFSLV